MPCAGQNCKGQIQLRPAREKRAGRKNLKFNGLSGRYGLMCDRRLGLGRHIPFHHVSYGSYQMNRSAKTRLVMS